MIETILWQIVSILILLPGFLGIYLLLTSPDKLTVRYQNYMLSKTMKPLKDEDFSNVKIVVLRLKALGFILIVASLASIFAIIQYI